MKYDMTKPCKKCPFVVANKFPLSKARKKEIMRSIYLQDQSFPCHETTEEYEDENGGIDLIATKRSQHCAGAMIVLEKAGKPNQMMRIAERLRVYDHTKLDMSVETVTVNSWLR